MCMLTDIPIGKTAVIQQILVESAMRDRYRDLGLTPGCRVKCLYAAPCGDPRAYEVRGTVLAIRTEDAKEIEVSIWD